MRYVEEIWFADRLWPSEDRDINKYETESSIYAILRNGYDVISSLLVLRSDEIQ